MERQRWQQQVMDASEFEPEEAFEVDVVVIGTGAGGAAAAYELASRGLAVLILEEGHYYARKDFTGPLPERVPQTVPGQWDDQGPLAPRLSLSRLAAMSGHHHDQPEPGATAGLRAGGLAA